jgi:hypothetical protein
MIRKPDPKMSVTLMLQSSDGAPWPLHMSADCIAFIGRYRRVDQFGPASGLLHFLPGQHTTE